MGKPEDFYRRLKQVCDDSPIIPPFGQGRQVYLATNLGVTQEAVRKWFTGESRPRTAMMRELAKLLEVDEAWLALGIEPEMDRREKKAHHERTEGGIYLAYGLFTLAGGHCAFPSDKDPRASYVDFYVIVRGTQSAIHIAMAREVSRGRYAFVVPREYREVRCIGVVPVERMCFTLLDLKSELIDVHKEKKGGDFEVHANYKDNSYHIGADTWPVIPSVGAL